MTKRNIETPGAASAVNEAEDVSDVAGSAPDDSNAAQVTALQLQVTQMAALLKQLVEGGRAELNAEDVTKPARIIGEDVRPMTSFQLLAAVKDGKMQRPTRTVMCADGYLAPEV